MVQLGESSISSGSISSGSSQRAESKRFLLLLFVIAAGPRRKVGDASNRFDHLVRCEFGRDRAGDGFKVSKHRRGVHTNKP